MLQSSTTTSTQPIAMSQSASTGTLPPAFGGGAPTPRALARVAAAAGSPSKPQFNSTTQRKMPGARKGAPAVREGAVREGDHALAGRDGQAARGRPDGAAAERAGLRLIDKMYDPNLECQSHMRELGKSREFGRQAGRTLDRLGTRASAEGDNDNWYPVAPENVERYEKVAEERAVSGIHFEKQITRRQDVNGKLLSIQMTRFLFGANMVQGPSFTTRGTTSMLEPGTSPRNNSAQFCAILRNLRTADAATYFSTGSTATRRWARASTMKKQAGRIPLNRQGTRAAADGGIAQ